MFGKSRAEILFQLQAFTSLYTISHYISPSCLRKFMVRSTKGDLRRRLCTFFKIKTSGKPEYLLNLIPTGQNSCNTRSLDQTETYYCRTDAFKNSFFPYTIVEWKKLDFDIRKSKSYAIFPNALLKIGRPNQCSIYSIHNPVGFITPY